MMLTGRLLVCSVCQKKPTGKLEQFRFAEEWSTTASPRPKLRTQVSDDQTGKTAQDGENGVASVF